MNSESLFIDKIINIDNFIRNKENNKNKKKFKLSCI